MCMVDDWEQWLRNMLITYGVSRTAEAVGKDRLQYDGLKNHRCLCLCQSTNSPNFLGWK